VFFKQERVGLNRRRFRMIKFRSMVTNAEELRAKLEKFNEVQGAMFKMAQDPRVTRVGRIIRKYSIDELPQLINVLSGEMSLVGPRPALPQEVSQYSWNQRRRLSVKPGLTGLSQVSGRSSLSFKETVDLDLYYIDQWSIALVFKILLNTIPAVLKGRGAY
jgi:lipopolysaccharide/colanic/teichoic acid biosynthesis glycosyltransferase